jgi:lactose/L-arabinose transport system ATP-binding protein
MQLEEQPMSGLKLERVTKRFGDVQVIEGADLEVAPGEFVVFVGPSGCGKSTLLRMIAGLEEISSGRLTIGGKDMSDVDPAKRGVAMVFQSYALYPHMTVAENMGFSLAVAGRPKAEIAARVKEVARTLELLNLLDRKPKQLSGGQRQRVAIGRAIVREPEVFLFDEPLSNLDAELRVQMRIEIARLHRQLGATIIYVTHDQVEAMTLADRIVVLRAGKIEQVGSPLELYDNPENAFVAGFIGSPKMNLLPGEIAAADGRSCKVTLPGLPGSSYSLRLASPPKPGTKVTLGIRPEHFSDDGEASFELTLDVIEHLGGETFAYCRAANGTTVVVEVEARRRLEPGQRFSAAFDPTKALLFASDGDRIL